MITSTETRRNGDYSGKVTLIVKASKIEFDERVAIIPLDMEDLEAFVLGKWRGALIEKIEQLEGPELLAATLATKE